MKYGYVQVSTGGQSLAAQTDQLTEAGGKHIFKVKVSGAISDRPQLHRLLKLLDEGDVLLVTRLDRLARSTRDRLNTLALVAERRRISGPSATVGPTPPPRMAG